tara:strand:- start:299 stop:514 length:216 start_codon:yes stop_codon:yes gene_type:complete
MTVANTNITASKSPFSFFSRIADGLRAITARSRLYARTTRELSELSDRELADIGISRGEIRHVARQAAEKV